MEAPVAGMQAMAETAARQAELLKAGETLKNLSPRNRGIAFGLAGVSYVKERREKGGYENDGGLKTTVEKLPENKRIDQMESDEIKDSMTVWEGTKKDDGAPDEYTQRVVEEVSPFVKIRVGEGEGVREYSYKEWQGLSPEEKTQLESQPHQYIYEAPQEPQGLTVEAMPRTNADRIIDKHLLILEEDWQAGNLEGGADAYKVKLNEQKRELLRTLRLAKEAKGEDFGAIFKLAALQGIKDMGGQDVTLPSELDRLTGPATEAKANLMTYLNEKGLSAEQLEKAKSVLATEGLAGLVKVAESLPELKDLDQRIFGREISEDELRKIFETRDPNLSMKLTKQASLWALVLLVFSGFKLTEKITEEASR